MFSQHSTPKQLPSHRPLTFDMPGDNEDVPESDVQSSLNALNNCWEKLQDQVRINIMIFQFFRINASIEHCITMDGIFLMSRFTASVLQHCFPPPVNPHA